MQNKDQNKDIPPAGAFLRPVFKALKELGGSGSIEEINARAWVLAGVPKELLDQPHYEKNGRPHGTEVGYRLHWARSILKLDGWITNSKRGVWSLTERGASVDDIDPDEVLRRVRGARPKGKGDGVVEPEVIPEPWRDELSDVLQQMAPGAFERLAQRILREAGFVQVEVTGRTGDGGIDGYGTLKLNEMLSVQALFQCKRYSRSVPSKDVREFCGALTKRHRSFGIFLATNAFTSGAREEADGPLSIELIDLEKLLDLLKELGLGVEITYKVDRSFFDSI